MSEAAESDTRFASTPLYLQLAATLRRKIVEREIGPGEALPSERDLCDILGASRVTVRKAIEMLTDEGLLTRRQGSGTFVTERIEAPGSQLSSFSADAEARGAESDTIWIMKSRGQASAEEAQLLEIATGAPVIRLSRVRLAGGEPLAVENAIVPADMLPALDAVGSSLYRALESNGNRPVGGRQRIRAALAGPTEAGLLTIAEDSEILRIERITRRADGRPVELTRSAYRGDRFDFVSELRLP
ncbi:GntR family transcriptional regulator [Sphingopyxis kveilinensis]|uniref:GntR family transcriptional regulator n=1 Tax=Sphingopyxis kveilinensis TaxID=3114367 RepID=UPI0030D43E76